MYRLRFSSVVNQDIIDTIHYIKNTLKAPQAAENHVNELKKQYDLLKENPHIRPLVKDEYLASMGIRFIMVKKYMLIYFIEEEKQEVFIYRLLYGSRDWVNILTNNLNNKD